MSNRLRHNMKLKGGRQEREAEAEETVLVKASGGILQRNDSDLSCLSAVPRVIILLHCNRSLVCCAASAHLDGCLRSSLKHA